MARAPILARGSALLSRGGRGSRGATRAPREGAPEQQRTLRRDLDAIEALGFPLYADRAGGEVRWKLLEGCRRSPPPS